MWLQARHSWGSFSGLQFPRVPLSSSQRRGSLIPFRTATLAYKVPAQRIERVSPGLPLGNSDAPGRGGGYTRSLLHTPAPRVGSHEHAHDFPFPPSPSTLASWKTNIGTRMVSRRGSPENVLIEM